MPDHRPLTTEPLRFGVFEIDSGARELRKHGIRIKLQDQPFAVLLMLLERPGQLVTKEELQRRLWPADTFVEFDKGIYNAMKRLRETLGDEAETPRYIETIPKRGYRFICPVDRPSLPANPELGLPSASAPTPMRFQQLTVRRRWIAVFAVALILISSAGIWHISRKKEPTPPPIEVVPLTSLHGYQISASFSPDGNQVAFAEYLAGLYTMFVGGEKPLRLTDNPGDCCPVWSPDGNQIAFVRYRNNEEMSVYVISPLGGTEHRLYTIDVERMLTCGGLDWSPDGRLISFSEPSEQGMHTGVALLSLGDLTVRRLTTPPADSYDCEPTFSPNGSNIAFTRGSSGGNRRDVFVLPVTGDQPKQLTFGNSGLNPAWTQDGKEIVFSSDRGGLMSLWRISSKGGTPRAVTGVGPGAMRPSISRKGNLLAYEYFNFSDSIWRLDLSNETHSKRPAVQIISSRGINMRPSFSPDGEKVVFESDRLGYSDIWYCDIDGSNCTQLTSLRGTAGSARWSPDGHHIVFEFQSEHQYDIYLVEVPGGRPRVVPTFPGADNGLPNWSRDGQWIYFYSTKEDGRSQLWKVPFKGGAPVQVTRNGGVYPVESPDGRYLYYSKVDRPGIWKMPVNGGEETRILDTPQGRSWALAPKGIYFLDSTFKPNGRIEFFDFASRQAIPVLVLDKPARDEIALSPDQKSLLFVQNEFDSYIMLVKNFH